MKDRLRGLTVFVTISIGINGCVVENSSVDSGIRLVNCSEDGEPRLATREMFLSPGQEIVIGGERIVANRHGVLLGDQTYIQQELRPKDFGLIEFSEENEIYRISYFKDEGKGGFNLNVHASCDE